jgi:hypothetical protein
VLNFVFLRFVNMCLNGARGLALAAMLGAREYGVFGTLIVLQQYLSYAALGAREGVAIRLARATDGDADATAVHSSALAWGFGVGAFIVCAFGVAHYGFDKLPAYYVLIGLLSLASIVNEILINIARHEGRLAKVAGMEFVYQGGALLLVACLWKWMGVAIAVTCLLVSLAASLFGYLATLRSASLRSISWRTTKDLVRIGIPAAMFSAVVVVFNSCFVLIANGMELGDVVGHVVLATNISVMLLFGLNTVSWAMASRTMSRLYIPPAGPASPGATVPPGAKTLPGATAPLGVTGITDVFLRIGIIAAVLLALCAQPLLSRVMPEYANSAQFIVYFCLFQSYSLLLFSESNFLNVNSKLVPVLIGYMGVMALIGLAFLSGLFEYLTIVQAGVVLHFALAMSIALYARRLGFSEGRLRERAVALCFPVLCLFAEQAGGPVAVIGVCAVYLIGNLIVHRERTAALFVAAFSSRRPAK